MGNLDPKVLKLVISIRAMSKARKVTWQTTTDDHRFIAPLPRGAVAIRERRSRNSSDPDYGFEVIDSEGEVVDSIWDTDVSGAVTNDPPENLFVIMEELYKLARRAALNVDDVVDDLLGDIDKL